MLDNLFAFLRETFAPFFELFISGNILTEQSVQAARESFTPWQVASIALAVVVLIWGFCTRNATSKLVAELAERLKEATAHESELQLKRKIRIAKRIAMWAAGAGNRRVSEAALRGARRSKEEIFRLQRKTRTMRAMRTCIEYVTWFFTLMQIVFLLDGVFGFIPLSLSVGLAFWFGVFAFLAFLASLYSSVSTANNIILLSDNGFKVRKSSIVYMSVGAFSHIFSALVAFVNALILTMEACVAYGIVV